MELQELESMWAVYDRKLSENTRINKEVLRRLLMEKPHKRITGMSLKAALELVIPLIILVWGMFQMGYRNDWQYWIGAVMFFSMSTLSYYWSINYFRMVRNIDFSKPVIRTRKQLKEIELFKLNRIKIGYGLGPFGVTGVFLMADIHIVQQQRTFFMILPLILIVIVFAGSLFLRYRYGIVERFEKFRQELDELEALEKE